MHIQRRSEGLCAVADVLKFVAALTPGPRREVGMLALDGLDPRLLVDAQHHGSLGARL